VVGVTPETSYGSRYEKNMVGKWKENSLREQQSGPLSAERARERDREKMHSKMQCKRNRNYMTGAGGERRQRKRNRQWEEKRASGERKLNGRERLPAGCMRAAWSQMSLGKVF